MRPRTTLLIVLLAWGLVFLSCNTKNDATGTAQASKTITIGFTPAENAENVETNGEALAGALEKYTGLKIKVYVASSYAAVVEALAHDQIDFAWLPPFSLIQAEKLCNAVPLIKAMRYGSDSYYGGIIVRRDSPIKTIQDLKGKNIAWADVASTSGHIFPKAHLLKEGIDANNFFKRELYAGGHDKVVIAVLSGQVDAGGTWVNDATGKTGSWNKYFKDRSGEIRALFVTKPIPNDTFSTTAAFKKQHPEIVKKILDALEKMTHTATDGDILKKLYGIEGISPAKMSDFDVVRQAAEVTDIWQEE